MVVDKILAYLSQEKITLDEWRAREFGTLCQVAMSRQANKFDGPFKWRVSSSGDCARKLAMDSLGFEANGKEQDSRSKLTFLFGDMIEAVGIVLAQAAGVQMLGVGLKQIEVKVPGLVEIIGHPDGIVYDDGLHLFECKSMNDRAYGRFEDGEIDEKYLAQVNLYMGALKLQDCVFIAFNKNNGLFDERIVPFDREIANRAYANILKASRATKENLPERLPFDEKGFAHWSCVYCKFYGTCMVEPGVAEKVLVKNAYKLKKVAA